LYERKLKTNNMGASQGEKKVICINGPRKLRRGEKDGGRAGLVDRSPARGFLVEQNGEEPGGEGGVEIWRKAVPAVN